MILTASEHAARIDYALSYYTRGLAIGPRTNSKPLDDGRGSLAVLLALAGQTDRLREALSWALDVHEITLERLDEIEPDPPTAHHLEIRAAGMAKARAALSVAGREEERT